MRQNMVAEHIAAEHVTTLCKRLPSSFFNFLSFPCTWSLQSPSPECFSSSGLPVCVHSTVHSCKLLWLLTFNNVHVHVHVMFTWPVVMFMFNYSHMFCCEIKLNWPWPVQRGDVTYRRTVSRPNTASQPARRKERSRSQSDTTITTKERSRSESDITIMSMIMFCC